MLEIARIFIETQRRPGVLASWTTMAKDVLILSLGRVIADEVRVDPSEAHAVLHQVWQRVRASRDLEGAVIAIPALDAMGITAFGDFEVRKSSVPAARSVRRPHQLAHELGTLLMRLLSSAGPPATPAQAACLDAARRATAGAGTPGVRAIVAPDALFNAIEAFRPRDASAALAGLYARWMRTTESGQTSPRTTMHDDRLPLGLGAPRPVTVAPPDDSPITAARRRLSLAEQRARTSQAMPASPPPVTRVQASQADVAKEAVGEKEVAPARPLIRPATSTAGAMIGLLLAAGAAAWATGAKDVIAARLTTLPSLVSAWRAAHLSPAAGVEGDAGVSHTEVSVEAAASAVASSAAAARPTTTLRARRVLRAGPSGRAPYSPSFDPHRQSLMFHAGRTNTALLQASLHNDGSVGDVSTVRQDGSSSYHAQVSPDGEWLAYDSDAEGERGVYVAHRDGSSPRRVSGPGYASVPSWSPDGAYLAFARAEPDHPKVWNVWTVHVETGALRRHTAHTVGQPWGASWFPDGRHVAYSVEDRLAVLDLEDGETRSYPTPIAGRLVRTPAVSPDGQRIVFQVHHDGAWVLDVRAGTATRLLGDASAQEFAWAPDGKRVAYHSIRGGEWGIWMLDLAPAPVSGP